MTAISTSRTSAAGAKLQLRFDLIDGWCEREGVDRVEFAERCGIDPVTLWRLKTGRNAPTLETALRIAAVVGVSVEVLCARDES